MKKNIKTLTVLLFSTLIIISCGRNFKLNKGDLNYIPYEGNEILVFKSDKGRMDTIFLNGVGSFNACGDPLVIFTDKCEGKSLNCTRTDPNYDRYLEGKRLVKIVASSNGESHISFDIVLKGSCFYSLDSYSLSRFDSLPNTEFTIENRVFNDVKLFESGEYGKQYEHRENYVERFYWSKSEGFLGLDRRDEKWRLIKKYMP